MPEIAVIVPAYNHAPFIRERLDSVFGQTFRDFEVLVMDDASDDGSREIIENYPYPSDIKVTLQLNDVNSGSTFVQWAAGIKGTNSRYIWIAESDDVASPSFLSELITQVSSDESIALGFSDSNVIDKTGLFQCRWQNTITPLIKETYPISTKISGADFIESHLIHENVIPNASAVLFRRSAYEKVGGVDQDIRNCSDWLLWLKLLTNFNVVFLDSPLNSFRRHSNSVIAQVSAANSTEKYQSQYSMEMRMRFGAWLGQTSQRNYLVSALKKNREYIGLDRGNQGLHQLCRGDVCASLPNIMAGTFWGGFRSGFLKKACRILIDGGKVS